MSDVYAPCSDDSTSSGYSFSEDSLYGEAEEKICLEKPPPSKFRVRRRRKAKNPIAKSPRDLDQNFSQNCAQIKKPKSPRKQRPRSKVQKKNRGPKNLSGRKSVETESRSKSQIPKIENGRSAEKKESVRRSFKYDHREKSNVSSPLRGHSRVNSERNVSVIRSTERVILDIGDDVGSLDGDDWDTPERHERKIVTRLLHQNHGTSSQSTHITRCGTITDKVDGTNENHSSPSKKCPRSWCRMPNKKHTSQNKTVKPSHSKDGIQNIGKRNWSQNHISRSIPKAENKVTRIEVYMPRFDKDIEKEEAQDSLPLRKADRPALPAAEVRPKNSLDRNKSFDVIKTEISTPADDNMRKNLKYLRQKVDALKTKSSRRKWSIDPGSLPVLASKDEDTSPERQTGEVTESGNTRNTKIDENKSKISSKAIKNDKGTLGKKIYSAKIRLGFKTNSSPQKNLTKDIYRPSSLTPHLSDTLSPITAIQKTGELNIDGQKARSKIPESDSLHGSSTNQSLSSSHPRSSADVNRLCRPRAGGGKSYKQIYEEEKAYRALLEKKKKKWKTADPFAQNSQEPVKLSGLSHTRGGPSRGSFVHEEISNETWLERCHYMRQVKSQQTAAADTSNQKPTSSLVSPSSSPGASSKISPRMKSNIPRLPPINERKVIQKTELQKYRPSNKNEGVKQRARNRDRSISTKK